MSKVEYTTDDLRKYHEFAIDLARQAGNIIKEASGNSKSIESKQSFADLVTETDKGVEEFLFKCLKQEYPSHKFIGEENVASGGHKSIDVTNEPTWIIDPVDGTMNFVHTFPYVAVCIGMIINQEIVLGVVYCPKLDLMYTARINNGAYCNGDRLRVRESSSLADSLICAELGSDRDEKKCLAVFKNLQSVGWQSHGIRSLGSAAMNICSVASGYANAYYEFGLHCWDMCAAGIVLLEAGGYICDTTGQKFDLFNRRLIASCNKQIGQELSKALVIQLDLTRD